MQSEQSEHPELERALALSYRYLNRRERTVAELRSWLRSRDLDSAAIEQALEILIDQHLLDDERFAGLFAQDKRELDGWGAGRIASELRRRGVAAELISAVLEPSRADDELDRALALLQRRFPAPPRTRLERDRALSAMIRKGYGQEIAFAALARYVGTAAADLQ